MILRSQARTIVRQYAIWILLALGLTVCVPIPSGDIVTELRIAETDELEWAEFHADSYEDHANQFDALFNSLETKWSKNGRLMMRQGTSGSFKFVAKGK